MGRLINSTYLSLDGVVQNPQNYTFGYRSDDATAYQHKLLLGADALLMGRLTYEIFAEAWPTMTDETGMADRMNTLPKYVVSDTLTSPSWANTQVVPRAHARDRVRRLKTEVGTVVQYGYGPVTANLLDAGLVDEIHLWMHPLFAGAEEPADVISHTGTTARLELVDVTSFETGLVILVYRPAD